jgi:hypothetical protein
VAWVKKQDLKSLYEQSKTEAHIWREDYPAFERLADNGLMEGLDPNLPEVNDGSLSAALFKLPKRIVNKKLSGTVKAIDRDEAWLSELANMQWENEIIPNANLQAPFTRKWKDAVRKAAIYGSVPLITISTHRDGKDYTDFIVAQPQDVILEPGKVSDYDSDLIFWDVYYTKTQLETMIEQAKEETGKGVTEDGYNKWNVPAMEEILLGDNKDERTSLDTPRQQQDKNVRPKGYKFCIVYQRGVNAPFYMYYKDTNKTVREWSNPDPTGDLPVHFLYCYQDFINPYGIGIVKLAGGTQNVLDYMRQADVLATQLGLRPPINIQGNTDDVDIDSLVYAQDALWFTGNAVVKREELANGVYNQLPARMSMYQASLQKLIPTGDTSISGTDSGDPNMSKTPAGVKLAEANLSIDDEDFKDNLYVTYEAKAKSMINTHFANMEGEDLFKLSDDERDLLAKAGLEFPVDANGQMSNQLELIWDDVRAKFNFEVNPEQDKAKDDADRLEGLTKVAELIASDPTAIQEMAAAGKKFNKGELYADMIALSSDNDKIITDISPDDEAAMEQQGAIPGMPGEGQPDPMAQQQMQHADESHQMDMQAKQQDMELKGQKAQMSMQPQEQQAPAIPEEEVQANVQAIMQQYGVDETTALTALAAEAQGYPPEDVIAHLQKLSQGVPA